MEKSENQTSKAKPCDTRQITNLPGQMNFPVLQVHEFFLFNFHAICTSMPERDTTRKKQCWRMSNRKNSLNLSTLIVSQPCGGGRRRKIFSRMKIFLKHKQFKSRKKFFQDKRSINGQIMVRLATKQVHPALCQAFGWLFSGYSFVFEYLASKKCEKNTRKTLNENKINNSMIIAMVKMIGDYFFTVKIKQRNRRFIKLIIIRYHSVISGKFKFN